jgi:peptidoglycan/xylan/chitin deacetylase (PgdA/CDA1 family)
VESSTYQRRRAAQRARYRRRRRVAIAAIAAVIAIPIVAFAAFGGSGKDEKSASEPVRAFKGGKTAKRDSGGGEAKAEAAAFKRLLKKGLPIYCAGGKGNYVALTFDDGPSDITPLFHELLRKNGVRATFFIVGGNMVSETYAEYAREDVKLGEVADHTWTHDDLTKLSAADARANLVKTNNAIRGAVDKPVKLFRPPYGARNPTTGQIVNSLGMVQVVWNVDSRDWSGVGWQQIAANVLPGLKPGSIVLMHDTRSESLKALEYSILPEIKRRGLKAVTLSTLFAKDPPSDVQLAADAAGGTCRWGMFGS